MTQKAFNEQTSYYTSTTSNIITNTDGDVMYYSWISADIQKIIKWNNAASIGEGTNIKTYYFTTKDFTFGDIMSRKKIYKVYITYKSNESDTNIEVLATRNGTGDFTTAVASGGNKIAFDASSKFVRTSTACYTGSSLQGTGDIWKTAELKFDTSSDVNNIYSFQLRLSSASVVADFEINDISIVYRVKRVK